MENSNLTQEDLISIKILSTITTSLSVDNYKGITETDLYYSALIDYLNLPKNKNLLLTHQKLSLKDGYGQLLNSSITLSLFEKDFRINGIKNKKSIEKYNELVKDFQNALDFFVTNLQKNNLFNK